MNEFKVSVIIPVYNSFNTLERAVKSALCQPEVGEVILVEDGSNDKSLELCERLSNTDTRIVIRNHKGRNNRGVAASRNLGIQIASRVFIAFLDADDYYLPGRFETTKNCFQNDCLLDGVYEMTGVYVNNNHITPYLAIEAVAPEDLFENLQPLGNKVWFSSNGLTLKKKLLEKAGYFDEKLLTSEDTLQWFKIAATGKIVAGNITNPVSIAEQQPGSLTSNNTRVKSDFLEMLYKLYEFASSANLSRNKKELILQNLLGRVFNKEYGYEFNRFNKLKSLLRICAIDPGYLFRQSKTFKRFVGNVVGYNFIVKKLGIFR